MNQTISLVALPELVRGCQRETRRYQRGETSDPLFCLEIFRRALQQERIGSSSADNAPIYTDNAAREALVVIYSEYVRAQIQRKAVRSALIEELVQEVWRNFWQAANTGLSFEQLPQALAYLRQVTVSQVIRFRRMQQQSLREASIHELVEAGSQESTLMSFDPLFAAYVQERFYQRCTEVLNETEWRVFRMRYTLGYKPQELAQRLNVLDPQAQYTSRKVSDLLDRIFRRLSDDKEIRDLLHHD